MNHWGLNIGKLGLIGVLSASLTSGVPLNTSSDAYDAIVCGGGVSGNVAAARLAASGAKTLLLERGPASTAKSGGTVFLPWNDTVTVFDVPSFASNLGSLNKSWSCTDTAGGAGCVFGGGGSMNALVWVPPSRWDFDDRWPEGWKYDDIQDAYRNVESFNPGSIHASSDGVFYEGSPLHYVAGMLQAEGWTQVDAITNPNEKYQVYGQPPQNIIQGQGIRAGPADVLFSQALSNPNFSWRLHSYVVRVVRSGGLATGVEVQNNDGSRYIVNLNQGGKIILTAGALSTPRILFNSGIGPKDQIQIVQNGTTNITLPPEDEWLELPVGHNLRDHPIVHLAIDTENGQNFTYWNSSLLWNGGWNTTEVDMYNTKAAGPIAQGPQRAILWTHALGSDNLTHYMQSTFEESGPGKLSILGYQTHGQTSTGIVGIEPNGTTVLLQKPWFNTEGDITASTAWVDRFRSYLDSSPNLKLDAAYEGLDSRSIVTNNYSSGVHWAGTAIIGAENDGNSVVDLNVKVWGTQNIFVADTSFHADVPTGNMQAQAAIAAEAAIVKIIAAKV